MHEQGGKGLGYIPAIDGLRAVAVAAVVLFHLRPTALPGGFTGVDIFFVISGFVVTGSMLGREFASMKALAAYFYARRFVRILPALVAMLLATILASALLVPEGWLSRSVSQVALVAFFGLSNVVLATDSDDYFGPLAIYNPFTHSWSLGVEEQFYLFFPFLIYWHQRLHQGPRAVRWIAILSAASLLLAAVLAAVAPRYGFYLVFSRFWELGAGMLLCLTRERWIPLARRRRDALSIVALVLVGIALAIPEGPLVPFPLALLPVLGAVGLIAVVTADADSPLARVLATRPFVALGLVSYSLYLWHWPVIVLFRWTTGLQSLGFQLAALTVAIVLAVASYRLIERPLRDNPWLKTVSRGRVIRGAIALTMVGVLVGWTIIADQPRVTLSVTGDHHAWYAEPDRALDPALSHCEVVAKQKGPRNTWAPTHCQGAMQPFTLFVPGDSHALAYIPALRQLVAERGVTVHVYFKAGCPYMKLIDPTPAKCAGYLEDVTAEIARDAKPGDAVFLPGLRLTRFTNQFEGDRDLIGPRDDSISAASFASAEAAVARFVAAGAGVTIEAPKPIFRSPTFRCADAFTRGHPICAGGTRMPRAELLALRAPVLATLQRLAATSPGVRVWDPFPLLCPGETCDALPGGRPLFFDGDHLSGLGNDQVYPALRDAILASRRTAVASPGR